MVKSIKAMGDMERGDWETRRGETGRGAMPEPFRMRLSAMIRQKQKRLCLRSSSLVKASGCVLPVPPWRELCEACTNPTRYEKSLTRSNLLE